MIENTEPHSNLRNVDTTPAFNADVVKNDKNLGTISKIEVNLSGWGGGIFYVDEIRMARTWDKVIGNADYYCPTPPHGDFDGDCQVDFNDLMILCDRWLMPTVFDQTDIVDFAVLSTNWLLSERVSYQTD